MDTDLPFLATFTTVYEVGNVTRAAASLGRTQPTVSYQLRRLEEELGQPLFVRRAARVVATPLADELYRLVRGFARDVATLRKGEGLAPAGLDLAAVSAFGRYVLFPILLGKAFERRPVTLRFPELDEVLRRVRGGQVDAGFVYRAPVDAHLSVEPVYEETLDLLAGPTWARRLRSIDAFQDIPLITYDDGDYVVGRWFGHHFGRRAPRWSSVSHFEEVEEVVASVAKGRGVAILPGFCARAMPGKVRIVRWGRPPLRNTVFAVRRAGAPDHPGLVELLAALRALPPEAGPSRGKAG
ncbi:LysR family transcriptional regulator [Pendulispora albinea]|uniref:LysR family transcriptional regulator n=1 Tax=Pendulispora albinea TaxID=2741071 RepID=A0ABZ2M8U4_9BACT